MHTGRNKLFNPYLYNEIGKNICCIINGSLDSKSLNLPLRSIISTACKDVWKGKFDVHKILYITNKTIFE